MDGRDEKTLCLQKINERSNNSEQELIKLCDYYDASNVFELTLSEVKEYLINVMGSAF